AHEVGLQAAQNEKRRVRVERAPDYTEVGAQAANQLASPDDGATHDVPGAGGVLGQAVDIQVDVVLAVLVESGERVVQQGQRSGALRQTGQCGEVGDLRDRVGGALEDHQPRRGRGEHTLHTGNVLDREHGVPDTEAAEQAPHEIPCRVVGLD